MASFTFTYAVAIILQVAIVRAIITGFSSTAALFALAAASYAYTCVELVAVTVARLADEADPGGESDGDGDGDGGGGGDARGGRRTRAPLKKLATETGIAVSARSVVVTALALSGYETIRAATALSYDSLMLALVLPYTGGAVAAFALYMSAAQGGIPTTAPAPVLADAPAAPHEAVPFDPEAQAGPQPGNGGGGARRRRRQRRKSRMRRSSRRPRGRDYELRTLMSE